jgi:hypothetical protein
VKAMVKSFCGVSLVGLSLVAHLHLAWDPLCVSHNEHLPLCQPNGHCQVILVDYIDVGCTRAFRMWAIAPLYPMWETWLDDRGGGRHLSPHVNQEKPYLSVVDEFDI